MAVLQLGPGRAVTGCRVRRLRRAGAAAIKLRYVGGGSLGDPKARVLGFGSARFGVREHFVHENASCMTRVGTPPRHPTVLFGEDAALDTRGELCDAGESSDKPAIPECPLETAIAEWEYDCLVVTQNQFFLVSFNTRYSWQKNLPALTPSNNFGFAFFFTTYLGKHPLEPGHIQLRMI